MVSSLVAIFLAIISGVSGFGTVWVLRDPSGEREALHQRERDKRVWVQNYGAIWGVLK